MYSLIPCSRPALALVLSMPFATVTAEALEALKGAEAAGSEHEGLLIASLRDLAAALSLQGQNELALPIRESCGAGFADASECARKFGVILRGDQTIQGHHRQRRILTRLVPAVFVRAARSAQRVSDLLDMEGL